MKNKGAWAGGGAWPSNKLGEDGKFGRADLHMKKNPVAAPGGAPMPLDREGDAPGTSVFDPVLCELIYSWFCPPAGIIFDPFAGGSVRGIVASKLGRPYVGIELNNEQIEANREQANDICEKPKPKWICGDSRALPKLWKGKADLVFSCPPYGDLERYSDDSADLSTMTFGNFLKAYREIVSLSVAKLLPNRFACFVVGDFRDKKGFYRNFVGETVAAFENAGAKLYNEAILVTAVGSLPIRVGPQFMGYRKLGKTHQNVLVFFKGDPKKIAKDFGEVHVVEMPNEPNEPPV